MKKSENLMATLLAVYAIILVLCIAIYAIFKLLEVDITLATNLLLWSAAIFAPIVLIFTFNNWKKEKSSELISKESRDLIVQMKVFSDGTKQLIGKIFCNYMHELENSNLQRFFPKKVDKSQGEFKHVCFKIANP